MQFMHGRILILSDTHFGRPRGACRSAEMLRPLWRDCDTLIINGDVAEVHHPKWRGSAAREVVRLAELCETDEVRLVLLSGNHDPFLSDTRHLILAEGEVFVTHGDVLHPAVAPWSPRAGCMRAAHEMYLEQIPFDDRQRLETMLAVSQHASHKEWELLAEQASRSSRRAMLLRPWKIGHVLWYWNFFPALAAQFLAQHAPEARFGVFGHTHHPDTQEIGGRVIINTGCFGFPGKPRAVTLEERTLAVWPIERRRNSYQLADQPLESFELFHADPLPQRAPLAA